MPDYLISDAKYPGVTAVLSGSYACSHGTSPGRALLTIPPTSLDQIAEVGDLTFSDGTRSITLRGCKVTEPSYNAGAGGQTEALVIEDRRWQWALAGVVFLRANIPDTAFRPIPKADQPLDPQGNPPVAPPIPHGEEAIRPETRRTAPELAKFLLEALGEKRYDVSALDPKATPAVDWDGVPPAAALNQLVEPLGCRVVLQPVADRVLIAKVGEGAELPDAPATELAPGFDVKARPAKVICFGAPVRVQMRFFLESVCLDFDDVYRTREEVSWRPKKFSDWGLVIPPTFGMIAWGKDEAFGPGQGTLPGGRIRADAVALAARSLYRSYRVKPVGADGHGKLLVPPDDRFKFGPIKDVRLLRLLPVRNLAGKDDVGRSSQSAAICLGRHQPPQAQRVDKSIVGIFQATRPITEVKVTFSIDQELSIIHFSHYLYAIKSDNRYYPAEIVLECACEVADPKSFQWLRYKRERAVSGGLDTRIATVVNPDVRFEVIAEYAQLRAFQEPADPKTDSREAHVFKKTTDNEKEIKGRADWSIAGELQKYEPSKVERRTYVGIKPIDPDGAIQQVSYQIAPGVCSTTASRNGEHEVYQPSYRQRRSREESDIDTRGRVERALVEIDRKFGGPLAGRVG